jgi:sec-independent protein translocase protein TatA
VGRIGMMELVVILGIVLLLFGSKKLPELADGMGKAIRNFKKGMSHDDAEDVTPPGKQVSPHSSAKDLKSEAGTPAERKS